MYRVVPGKILRIVNSLPYLGCIFPGEKHIPSFQGKKTALLPPKKKNPMKFLCIRKLNFRDIWDAESQKGLLNVLIINCMLFILYLVYLNGCPMISR